MNAGVVVIGTILSVEAVVIVGAAAVWDRLCDRRAQRRAARAAGTHYDGCRCRDCGEWETHVEDALELFDEPIDYSLTEAAADFALWDAQLHDGAR